MTNLLKREEVREAFDYKRRQIVRFSNYLSCTQTDILKSNAKDSLAHIYYTLPIYKHLPLSTMTQLAKLLVILAAASATLSAPTMRPRQLAGEGSFFDSVFSGTDNGVGYGVENAEDNAASLLGGKTTTGGGGSTTNPSPPPPKVKRQADKIANGAATDLHAIGKYKAADLVQTDGDNIDGQLTQDAATLGGQIGGDEEDALERTGDMVYSKMPARRAGVFQAFVPVGTA